MNKSTKKNYRYEIKKTLERVHLNFRKLKNDINLNRLQRSGSFVSKNGSDYYAELRKEINILAKHIDRDYCFLDLPDYNNVGDHLICKGSLNFLDLLPYKNKYKVSAHSFNASRVNSNDLIILQGGGNFGDLWPRHQIFREDVASTFRQNKIIVFPQTIFFQATRNLRQAVKVFSSHPDLIICVRDQRSFELAENNFTKNKILLLPDMASYLSCGITKKPTKSFNQILYLKRRDKEFKDDINLSFIKKYHTKDWPSVDLNYYKYIHDKYNRSDFYTYEGILFLIQYDLVISTRLHGCILAVLMGIPTILLDNTYGKNKTYYEAWMKDISHCYFASNEEEVKKHFYKIIH